MLKQNDIDLLLTVENTEFIRVTFTESGKGYGAVVQLRTWYGGTVAVWRIQVFGFTGRMLPDRYHTVAVRVNRFMLNKFSTVFLPPSKTLELGVVIGDDNNLYLPIAGEQNPHLVLHHVRVKVSEIIYRITNVH